MVALGGGHDLLTSLVLSHVGFYIRDFLRVLPVLKTTKIFGAKSERGFANWHVFGKATAIWLVPRMTGFLFKPYVCGTDVLQTWKMTRARTPKRRDKITAFHHGVHGPGPCQKSGVLPGLLDLFFSSYPSEAKTSRRPGNAGSFCPFIDFLNKPPIMGKQRMM